MSHERVDYRSEDDLNNDLKRRAAYFPHDLIVSPNGTLVHLLVSEAEAGNSLGIDIEMLTVNGRRPAASTLRPFLKGRVVTTSRTPNSPTHGENAR